jgi:hypothetical protein
MIKVIYPDRISLNYWANSLVADYFTENLPQLVDSNENSGAWRKWGALVAGTGTFLAASVPSPVNETKFKKWEDWAKAVYLIMSNEYN